MRIAAFSDVHSNLPALEAVLEDIERLGNDVQIVVAGDFLNCGPFPVETLRLIRQLPNAVIIQGNHEGYVLENYDRATPLEPPYRAVFAPSVWTSRMLTSEDIEWIRALPWEAALDGPDGSDVRIVHGSPRQQTEGLRDNLDDNKLAEIFAGHIRPRRLWISGHTHQPYFKRWQGMTITSNGSTGLPLDNDSRACYLLAEWDEMKADWRVQHRRVKYDRDRALAATLANAAYDQGGPFMLLTHRDILQGRTCHITQCINNYLAQGDYPAPPDDFAHFERAVKLHLAHQL